MIWDYRVVRHGDADEDRTVHSVHEVRYAADGSIAAWDERGVVTAPDLEALPRELVRLAAAVDKPVLQERDGKLVEFELPGPMKRLTFDIPATLHATYKADSMRRGVSVTDDIRQMIEAYIAARR